MPKVLFLGANGRDTTRLRLGAEVRDIRRELQAAGVGDVFQLLTELAVRPSDLQSLLLLHTPDVIHFSGHGLERRGATTARRAAATGGPSRELLPPEDDDAKIDGPDGGIVLEDERGASAVVRPDVLLALFAVMKRDKPLRCVVLNACFTASQAEAIAEHVDCVVGAAREIDDEAAIAFATAFYRAIAHGKSIESAFQLGRIEIALRGLAGEDVPRLFCRPGVAPEGVFLVDATPPAPKRRAEVRQTNTAEKAPYHVELHLTRTKGKEVRPGLYDARLLDGESKGLDAVGVIDLGVHEAAAGFLDRFVQGGEVLTDEGLSFGQRLLDRLLGDIDVQSLWKDIQQRRAGGQRPLRLELVLPASDAEAVAHIPFELLADHGGFLFRRPGASFLRSVRGMPVRTLHLEHGDAILAAWANPRVEGNPLDAALFMEHERKTASAARSLGLAIRRPCPHATRATLEERLSGDGTAVVSLVARGDPRGGGLWLHRHDHPNYPKDPGELVSARDLAAIFRHGHVGVAFLWTPHGAGSNPISAALATVLLDPEHGDLTAVVTSHAALRFAGTEVILERILSALGGAAEVDLASAVGEGRMALPESDLQWAAPVYYARPRSGRTVTFVEQVAQVVETLGKATPAERGMSKSRATATTEPARKVVRRKKAPKPVAEMDLFAEKTIDSRSTRGGDVRKGVSFGVGGVLLRFLFGVGEVLRRLFDRGPPPVSSKPAPEEDAELTHPMNAAAESRIQAANIDQAKPTSTPAARIASSLAEAVELGLELLYENELLWITGAPGAGKTAFAMEMQRLIDAAASAQGEGPRAHYISLDGVDDVDSHVETIIGRLWLASLAKKRNDESSLGPAEPQSEVYSLLILDHLDALGQRAQHKIVDSVVSRYPELSILLVTRSLPTAWKGSAELRLGPLSPAAARELFLDAAGHRIAPEERDSKELEAMIDSLAGHPLSLVLAAKLVGTMPLASLKRRLLEKPAVDSSLEWLAENHPDAAEMFSWLGHLPAGLPLALLERIFGESADASRATLLRSSLANENGLECRLTLSPSLRERAREEADRLAPARRRDRLATMFHAIVSWLGAFPADTEDGVRGEQIALGVANLQAIARLLAALPPVDGDEISDCELLTEIAASLDRLTGILDIRGAWSMTNHLIIWMEPIVAKRLSSWRVLADLYRKNNRTGDALRLSALAHKAAGNHDEAAGAVLELEAAAAAKLLDIGRGKMKDNDWEGAERVFLELSKRKPPLVDASELARDVRERAAYLVSIRVPRYASRAYNVASSLFETAGDLNSAALALERSAEECVNGFRFIDAEERYLRLARLSVRLNAPERAAAAQKAASDARARQSRRPREPPNHG